MMKRPQRQENEGDGRLVGRSPALAARRAEWDQRQDQGTQRSSIYDWSASLEASPVQLQAFDAGVANLHNSIATADPSSQGRLVGRSPALAARRAEWDQRQAQGAPRSTIYDWSTSLEATPVQLQAFDDGMASLHHNIAGADAVGKGRLVNRSPQLAAIRANATPASGISSIYDWTASLAAPQVQLQAFDDGIGELHDAVAVGNHDVWGDPLPDRLAVQRKHGEGQGAAAQSERVHAHAESGVKGAGGALPQLDRVQASFGRFDVRGVKGHVGADAASACEAIGAEAYASGQDIAFRKAPSLHTVAHEAAHVVQQRAGVQLSGGVGASGDLYETHANAVADAVVRGESAEPLLAKVGGGGGGGGRATVQRQTPQDTKAGTTPGLWGSDWFKKYQTKEGKGPARKHSLTEGGETWIVEADGTRRKPNKDDGPFLEAEAKKKAAEDAKKNPLTTADGQVPPTVDTVPGPDGEPPKPTTGKIKPGPVFAAVPEGARAPLTSFADLQKTELPKWNDEVAWHSYFQSNDPMSGIQVDGVALAKDAGGGGLVGGAIAGGKAILVDTFMNIATSKIPFAQGMIEGFQLVRDPAAWLQGVTKSTAGNVAAGWGRISEGWEKGDILTGIEGLLTVLDGLNNVLGTVSNVLWIVAAASFLLSFFFPPAFPFAALCGQWAMTIGSVSTAISVGLMPLRFLLAGARSIQTAFSEADPAQQLADAEYLRMQSQKFGQEWTQNAGHKMRGKVKDKLVGNKQASGSGVAAGTPATPDPAKGPTSKFGKGWNGVVTVLSGGTDFKETRDNASKNLRTANKTSDAYRGRGEYASAGTGKRGINQQVSDMERAGTQMFASDKAREKFTKKNGAPAETDATRAVAKSQQALTVLDGHVEAAQKEVKTANDGLQKAQNELKAAKAGVSSAEGQLATNEAKAKNVKAIAKMQHAAERTLQEETKKLQAEKKQLTGQGNARKTLKKGMKKKSTRNREGLQTATTQTELYEKRVANTTSSIKETEAKIAALKGDIVELKTLVTESTAELSKSQNAHRLATTTNAAAESDKKGVDLTLVEKREQFTAGQGRLAEDQKLAQERFGGHSKEQSAELRDGQAKYSSYLDFTGDGKGLLYGHNKGAGVTGSATGLATDIIFNGASLIPESKDEDKQTKGGAGADVNPEVTTEAATKATAEEDALDARRDWLGSAGMRGDARDYKKAEDGTDNFDQLSYTAQLQVAFVELKGTLVAPPKLGDFALPAAIDTMRAEAEKADIERRQLQFQKVAIDQILAHSAKEMTGLEACQAIARANQDEARRQRAALEERVLSQDELEGLTNVATGEAGKSGAAGKESGGLIAGFIGGFFEMLGAVPQSLTGGSGAGNDMKKVDTGAKDHVETTDKATETLKETSEGTSKMKTATTEGMTSVDTSNTELIALSQSITAEQLAAAGGVTLLEEARVAADAGEKSRDAEYQQLTANHAAAVATGGAWADGHEKARTKGMGDLAGIIRLDPAKKDMEDISVE